MPDSIPQRLERLNNIAANLLSLDSFKEYITLYIESRHLSEDFLMILCEHQFLYKLFTSSLPSLLVLECFNLLLANTSTTSDLVYVFSQPIIHEYLFVSFNVHREGVEAVEYYAQLLKAIIMKLSLPKTSSLIKLFCNNRYPSFPLLTNVTLLATIGKETLIKVTARQSILQLIQILDARVTGRGYLAEIPMIVFFYELLQEYVDGKDEQSTLKYIIDLLFALKHNPVSSLLLRNAICNTVIIPNLLNPIKCFIFLGNLRIESDPVLQEEIKGNLFRVLGKYSFNVFINSTYFTALSTFDRAKRAEQPILTKLFHEHFVAHCSKIMEVGEQKVDGEKVIAQWHYFNHVSREVEVIKDAKRKTQSHFFSNIWKKITNEHHQAQQYIKIALETAGVRQEPGYSLNSMLECMCNNTAVYTIESLSERSMTFGQHFQDTAKEEIHINEMRGKFSLSNEFMRSVILLAEGIVKEGGDFLSYQMLETMQGEYHYCYHIKKYLEENLHEWLTFQGRLMASRTMIAYIYTLTQLLRLEPTQNCRKKIAIIFEASMEDIESIVMETDSILPYITQNLEDHYLHRQSREERDVPILREMASETEVSEREEEEGRKDFRGVQSVKNMMYYSVIPKMTEREGEKSIQSPHKSEMRQPVRLQSKKTAKAVKIHLKFLVFQLLKLYLFPAACVPPSLNCICKAKLHKLNLIQAVQNMRFVVQFEGKTCSLAFVVDQFALNCTVCATGIGFRMFELMREKVGQNQHDRRVAHIGNNYLEFQSQQMLDSFLKTVGRWNLQVEECVVMSTLEYVYDSFKGVKQLYLKSKQTQIREYTPK